MIYHKIYTSALNQLREEASKRKKATEKPQKMPKIKKADDKANQTVEMRNHLDQLIDLHQVHTEDKRK